MRESITKYDSEETGIEFTKSGDVFKRFSGFINDKRINPDGSLKPGTYATTEEDAKNVKIRIDAIRRYSLPPGNTAQYVFTIKPHKYTKIEKGIVQPNFGQPGGGVEVFFIEGTSPQTVLLPPDEVPEK